MNFRVGLTVVGAVFLIIFILQNTGLTDIVFLFWSFRMSKVLLAILCVLLGFVFGSYFWLKISKREESKRT